MIAPIGFFSFIITVIVLFGYVLVQFAKHYKTLVDTIVTLREAVLSDQRSTDFVSSRLSGFEESMMKMELAQLEYIRATKTTADTVQNIVIAITFNANEIDRLQATVDYLMSESGESKAIKVEDIPGIPLPPDPKPI